MKNQKRKRKVTIRIEEKWKINEFVPSDYILIANENDKVMHSISCTYGLDTMESMIGILDSFRKQLENKINTANNLIERACDFFSKNDITGFLESMTDEEENIMDIEKIKDLFKINDVGYKKDKDGNKS